jgi:hypothetical protein
MRSRIGALAIVISLAAVACSSYPVRSEPGARMSGVVRIGAATRAVVLFIEVRPGDRIELLSAEPVGVGEGASVRLWLSRPVIKADGSRNVGEALEVLEGAEVTAVSASPGPDNTVGIVAELTAQRPGRYELTAIRLRYRVDGDHERVATGIGVSWTVCADDPAPSECPD